MSDEVITGSPPTDVTMLLAAWSAGDRAALEALVPLVAGELRHIANRQLAGERPGHTLQATALVNEVYLRLVGQDQTDWKNRLHFFAICAQLMRQVLVDYARRRRAGKRGGGVDALPLDEALVFAPQRSAELLALDDALQRLAALDARKSQLVELRFFAGLNNPECAQVLGISENTVIRDWAFTRAWLQRELATESDCPVATP